MDLVYRWHVRTAHGRVEVRGVLYLRFGGAEATVEPGAVRHDCRLPRATRRVRESTDFFVDLCVQVGASYSLMPG